MFGLRVLFYLVCYFSWHIQFQIQRMKGVIKQVGRYLVGEVVGEGSFGKVYKGIDRLDKSEVALKFISKKGKNKKELEGLRSENEMLKKICHKNIIKLLDFLQTPNQIIIITEFAGENLADVLEKKKKFTYEEVRSYCRQIFQALCYLDQNQIAHRDLKPQNILIRNEVIKICDFGFARKLSASTTFMNSLKGTPLYIAPEILAIGPLNYTKKVDIWSFGIIIYELYAGRPPFWAQNLPRLKPKILYQPVKYPVDIPLELKALIDRMLQKNPENRADWKELRQNEFFREQVPLKQIKTDLNTVQGKKIQKAKLEPQIQIKKKQSQTQIVPEGPVKLNKLTSQQDLDQIKNVETELLSGKADAKKLRVDGAFLEKIMNIFGSYFAGEGIVPKSSLSSIITIFIFLLTKVKSAEVDAAQDITKKKQLLFCAIKLAEQDNEPETIPNQLQLIGFLLKSNFDNVSIDFQTDQDVLEICLREIQAFRNITCFSHALIVLGTLANQGIVTISNSEQFFVKIEHEKVLRTIALCYEPIPSKKVVLECLVRFIHSDLHPSFIFKNHHALNNTFQSLKEQVASALLERNFLTYNPLTIFKETSQLENYAKVLYECLTVSEAFRKQFLKNTFWVDFLQHKNLRIFCFAYDNICMHKQKTNCIPNEVMKALMTSSEATKKNSTMEKPFLLARAQFCLSKKQTPTSNKQEATLILIKQLCQSATADEETKKKASKQIQGFTCTSQRIYEEVLGQAFCSILNDPAFDKQALSEVVVQTLFQNIVGLKIEEDIRISKLTASKLVIGVDELIKLEGSFFRTNKKLLAILGGLVSYFIEHSLVYQLQVEQGVGHVKKFLNSMYNILKVYSLVDEKQQYELYVKCLDKGIHNLLASENIYDKHMLAICLGILQKLIVDPKYANIVNDFVGLTLVGKLKNYLKLDLDDRDSEILVHMLYLVGSVIKKNEEYASAIKQLDIVSHFPRYLQHPSNENVRHQTLTLIGNMAKHSMYFFDDFANNNIFPCVADTVKRFGTGSKNKILKGIIYAVGNVSFYTERFCKDFIQLMPTLYLALTLDDTYLVSNTMSTISNLLRHSNLYLKSLLQHKIIKKVIQIVMDSQAPDNKMMFGLNMLKKALAYPEIFEEHPKSEFIAIYNQKAKIVADDSNQFMKKVRALM